MLLAASCQQMFKRVSIGYQDYRILLSATFIIAQDIDIKKKDGRSVCCNCKCWYLHQYNDPMRYRESDPGLLSIQELYALFQLKSYISLQGHWQE